MISQLYSKHAFDAGIEELVLPWSEGIVWHYFSGVACDEACLPCDAVEVIRFCSSIGEAGIEQGLKAAQGDPVRRALVRNRWCRCARKRRSVSHQQLPVWEASCRVPVKTAKNLDIGRGKSDHLMGRCWLKGQPGDAIHAVPCAAVYNLLWLMWAFARIGLQAAFSAQTVHKLPVSESSFSTNGLKRELCMAR